MTRHPLRVATAATACLAMLAACSIGGADRVGGESAANAKVLTMLSPFGINELGRFVDEVSRLSGGRLRISLEPSEHKGPDYESATVAALRDGQADLAVVGTRAWAELGAPSLGALGAPFLVDSYPLQEEVLTSGLVETMLEELPPDTVGIGVLPGPLRRPLGVAGALADPADFEGLVIGTQQSAVADETFRALGAHPQRLPINVAAPGGLDGLDGIELQVPGIEAGRLDVQGSHLMTNVNLWPRSLVVFASSTSYADLTDGERQVLRTAAKNVVPVKVAADTGGDEETAANLCRKNNTVFDAATPQQLDALRRAVEPVYADLRRDPGARAVIEGIEGLKVELAEPPTVVTACTPAPGTTSTGEATAVDGVWTMETDRSASAPEYFDENWGDWVFVLDRGRFAITQENDTSCTWGYGTYAVNGTRMSWTFVDGGGIAPNNATNRPGEYFVFDFSAYRDTVDLLPVEGEISPLNFRARPWRRLSGTPSTEHFSTRCPPPAGALDR